MADWKIPAPTEDINVEYTSFLQSRKFFAVDDSGSTAGAILRRERAFVDAFRASYANPDDAISLWGTHCDAPTSTFENVNWKSGHGCTYPSDILKRHLSADTIRKSDVWFLLTDGEIPNYEVADLARLAHEKELLNVPLVFVITGARKKSPKATDISVGISFFASSQDTLILFKETESGMIWVIAGKGCFASFGGLAAVQGLESWEDLQCFHDEADLFAHCQKLELYIILAEHRRAMARGLSLGSDWEQRQNGAVNVDLDLLAKAGHLSDDDLFGLLAEEAFNTLAVAYKTRNRISELRALLQKQKVDLIVPSLEDVAGAGDIIAQMGDAVTTDKERRKCQERLRVAHAKNREHYRKSVADFAESETTKDLKKRNQLVDAALSALASLEAAGFNAEILSRKSNRAKRAEVVSSVAMIDMAKLDLDASACKGFCSVCCDEDAVMSICFKELEPGLAGDNTTDFALNFPLAAGAASRNVDLVSSQHICFQCAVLASGGQSIYREPLVAVIPALQYDGSNKKYINDQLYCALTGRLTTGAAGVAQLFMSLLQELLNTKSWAGAGLSDAQLFTKEHDDIMQRRRTFQWMLDQLLENTFTREDFKETGEWVTYARALYWVAKDFDTNGLASFAITYPPAGFKSLLAFGAHTGAFNEDQLRRMKSTKLIYSIAAKYLADLLTAPKHAGSHEQWKQSYLEVLYQDFNGPLVPMDKGVASLVSDVDTFTSRLKACIADPYLSGGEIDMHKVQLLLFWLLYKQKSHCSAQTLFSTLRETEPLSTAVFDANLAVPKTEYLKTLLSIFAAQDTHPINPTQASYHVTSLVPFANPFGASVLRCGAPACNTIFCPLDRINDISDKTIQTLRTQRTKHLIAVFGMATRFETSSTGLPDRTDAGSPPTSLHINLHITIAREWAAHTPSQRRSIVADESSARQDFVDCVRWSLCKKGRGDIFNQRLDYEIRVLLPSFFDMLGKAMEMLGRGGEGVEWNEHDCEKCGVEDKVRWELEASREGLGEWEMA